MMSASGNSFGEERCVAAGYDNGDVKLFDLRTMSMRWEATLPNGVSYLLACWDVDTAARVLLPRCHVLS